MGQGSEGTAVRKAYSGVRGNLSAILQNSVRPGFMRMIGRKAINRFQMQTLYRSRQDSRAWCTARAESLQDTCASLDHELWAETERYGIEARDHARRVLLDVSIDFGGGGNYLLLYFMTRFVKPRVAVETGVALGWSSRAILSAMKKNKCGRLFSSDVPLFRIEEPEKHIGLLVDKTLRDRWQLFTAGDRHSLPRILVQIDSIDLVHYDSDKSYGGRRFATRLIRPHCSAGCVFMMDDIENDVFFEEWVDSEGRNPSVFEFEGKHTGMVIL